GDSLVVDPLPEGSRFELPVQHGATGEVERRHQRDDRAVHVVDRQDAHQPIAWPEAMPVGDAIGIYQEVPRCEHDPFGWTRRAGGVDDERLVFQTALACWDAGFGMHRRQRTISDSNQLAYPRQLGRHGLHFLHGVLPAEHDRGFRMLQDVALLVGGLLDVDRDYAPTMRPGAE